MTVETNNIHALRVAIERLDAFRDAIDDVALSDMDDDQCYDNIGEIKNILLEALAELEKPLLPVSSEEYVGRRAYALS